MGGGGPVPGLRWGGGRPEMGVHRGGTAAMAGTIGGARVPVRGGGTGWSGSSTG